MSQNRFIQLKAREDELLSPSDIKDLQKWDQVKQSIEEYLRSNEKRTSWRQSFKTGLQAALVGAAVLSGASLQAPEQRQLFPKMLPAPGQGSTITSADVPAYVLNPKAFSEKWQEQLFAPYKMEELFPSSKLPESKVQRLIAPPPPEPLQYSKPRPLMLPAPLAKLSDATHELPSNALQMVYEYLKTLDYSSMLQAADHFAGVMQAQLAVALDHVADVYADLVAYAASKTSDMVGVEQVVEEVTKGLERVRQDYEMTFRPKLNILSYVARQRVKQLQSQAARDTGKWVADISQQLDDTQLRLQQQIQLSKIQAASQLAAGAGRGMQKLLQLSEQVEAVKMQGTQLVSDQLEVLQKEVQQQISNAQIKGAELIEKGLEKASEQLTVLKIRAEEAKVEAAAMMAKGLDEASAQLDQIDKDLDAFRPKLRAMKEYAKERANKALLKAQKQAKEQVEKLLIMLINTLKWYLSLVMKAVRYMISEIQDMQYEYRREHNAFYV